jgi:hypothetical protein
MPWKYSGRIIRVGKAWTDNDGTKYPAVWSNYSADEKAAIGLTWEDDIAPYDKRFYWGRDSDGELIPRSLTDVNEVDEDGKAILDIETSITNASDLAAFMALYDTPVDSDGKPTGNAPINDWPDEI